MKYIKTDSFINSIFPISVYVVLVLQLFYQLQLYTDKPKLTLYTVRYDHENRHNDCPMLPENSCSLYWWYICWAWFYCFGNTGRYFGWYTYFFVVPVAGSRCLQEWCWNPQKEPSCWWCDSGGPKPIRQLYNTCTWYISITLQKQCLSPPRCINGYQ